MLKIALATLFWTLIIPKPDNSWEDCSVLRSRATADCMFSRSSPAPRGRTLRKCSTGRHLANAVTTAHETSNISITAEPRGTEARVLEKCCKKRPRANVAGEIWAWHVWEEGKTLNWWWPHFFGPSHILSAVSGRQQHLTVRPLMIGDEGRGR